MVGANVPDPNLTETSEKTETMERKVKRMTTLALAGVLAFAGRFWQMNARIILRASLRPPFEVEYGRF